MIYNLFVHSLYPSLISSIRRQAAISESLYHHFPRIFRQHSSSFILLGLLNQVH